MKKLLVLLLGISLGFCSEDQWWNEFKCSGLEITSYVRDLAERDHLAASWFLAGGKRGYRKAPCTEFERKNLFQAINSIAEKVFAGDRGKDNATAALTSLNDIFKRNISGDGEMKAIWYDLLSKKTFETFSRHRNIANEIIGLTNTLAEVMVKDCILPIPSSRTAFITLLMDHQNLSQAKKYSKSELNRMRFEQWDFDNLSDIKMNMVNRYFKESLQSLNYKLTENLSDLLRELPNHCSPEYGQKSITEMNNRDNGLSLINKIEVNFRRLKQIYEKNQLSFLKTFEIKNGDVSISSMTLKKRQSLLEEVLGNLLNEKARAAVDRNRDIFYYKSDLDALNSYVAQEVQDLNRLYPCNADELKGSYFIAINILNAQGFFDKEKEWKHTMLVPIFSNER